MTALSPGQRSVLSKRGYRKYNVLNNQGHEKAYSISMPDAPDWLEPLKPSDRYAMTAPDRAGPIRREE